jgi:ABC-2 type transport system permease protein
MAGAGTMTRRDPPVTQIRGMRRAAVAVLALTAKKAARSAIPWAVAFAGYVAYVPLQYQKTYPTLASREKLAASLQGNPGLSALLGQAPPRLETIASFTAWRTVGVLTLVGALWGLLTATRLTRGEEDAGRWEMLLAGLTTRPRSAAQAVTALTAGLAVLWVVTGAAAVAVGSDRAINFSVSSALFLATALITSAGMFLAVGVLAAQLAGTRSQANFIGAAVFGASFLVRMVADSVSGLRWMRWASPLGWVEQLHPLTGARPVAFVPIAACACVLGAAAVLLAGRRDLAASFIAARNERAAHTRLLGGAGLFAVRLGLPSTLGWVTGLAVLALMGGVTAKSAAKAMTGSAALERVVHELGGHGGSAAFLGIIFLITAALLSLAAAGQVAAIRSEEADGRAEHLLARAVPRWRWLAGRLAVSAGLLLAGGIAAGLAGWLGSASQHTGIGVGTLFRSGVNVVPAALFVLGVTSLAYGLWPRVVSVVGYGVAAWSFLIELIAPVIKNRWLLDSSVLHHVALAPSVNPDWKSAAWLAGLGALSSAAGIAAFSHRDLTGG